MSGSVRARRGWLVAWLWCAACGGAPSADLPRNIEDKRPAEAPAAVARPATPPEPVEPMRIGGAVSPPKPKSRLDIRWPGDPSDCYELGAAVFEYVVDSTGRAQKVRLIKGVENEHTQAARDAIARQQFEPATFRGKPVDVIYHVSINHVPLKTVKGPC
jgi:hypothetical protein